MGKIPIIEIFGPTIQGEGMVIGQKTMFIRTAGCDYSCVWCDSSFTWDGSEKDNIKGMYPQEIFSKLKEIGGDRFSHVTISGGNPLLFKQIGDLVEIFKKEGIQTAVETQGTVWQDWLYDIDHITISPKPPSSQMNTNFEKLDSIIYKLLGYKNKKNFSLKVVIFDEGDFDYARYINGRYPNIPLYLQVGNSDILENDKDKLLKNLLNKYEWLIDLVILSEDMNQVHVLPQLHSLVWGNKRAV